MFKQTNNFLNKLNIARNIYGKFDPNKARELSDQLIEQALNEVYHRGDMVMLGFITLNLVLAVSFGLFQTVWFSILVISIVSWSFFYFSLQLYPRTFFTRVVAGVVLQLFVLMHTYNLREITEIRYLFLVPFMVMIIYQDWKSMWPAVLLFFLQLFLFTYLGRKSESLYFINEDYKDFVLQLVPKTKDGKAIDGYDFAFFFVISIFQVSLAGVWAAFLRMQTISEASDKKTLMEQTIALEEINVRLAENVNKKTQDLQEALEASQANEEELRQNMEELQATQDELRNQSAQLLENQEAMKKVEQELRIRQTELEKSQWIETNLQKFEELMRLNYDKTLEDFSEIILSEMAELLESTQAAFYIFEQDRKILRMTAGYACTPKTVKKSTFGEGEGMIGQVIKNKKLTYLLDLPEDTAVIESALTKVKSKSLLILPLLYNEQLEGVIELAVFDSLKEPELIFSERLGKNIASMIQSIRGFLRTQELLIQSREMTSKIQQNARELESTKQEVEIRALEFQRLFNAINHSMLVVEYNMNGNIINVNDNFLRISRYSREELMHKHQSIFLPDSFVNSKEYKLLWDKILHNDFVEYEYECINKNGKSFFIKSNYYILGENDNKKIMNLAYDITLEKRQDRKILETIKELKEKEETLQKNLEETKRLKEELAAKAKEFQEQLNAINLSTAMIEYDKNGKIRYVNDKFALLMGYTKAELIGNHQHLFFEEKFLSSDAFLDLWTKLNNIEFIETEFEFFKKDRSTVWLRSSFYPVTDNRNNLTKVMQLSTNISQEIQQDEKIKDYLLELEKMKSSFETKSQELEAELEAIDKALGMIELSTQAEILKVNSVFADYFFYAKEELQGQKFEILFDKKYLQSVTYQQSWDEMRKGKYAEAEVTMLDKNKQAKQVWVCFYPVLDTQKKIISVLGVFPDIKYRK